jgi:type II secretory ATPase GspE/PulE/Tfp pilus assembly ATPase PilB-like protein
VCPHCSEPYQPTAEELAELRVTPEEIDGATFMKGSGCDRCRHTGYSGRVAIYEILPFSTEIKELTVQRATSSAIKNRGKELGMRTLRDSGWLRVKSGLSTIDEIFRVTSDTDVVFE